MANPMWFFFQDGDLEHVYEAMINNPKQGLLNLFEIEAKLQAMKDAGEVVGPYLEVVDKLRKMLGQALQGTTFFFSGLSEMNGMLEMLHQTIGRVSGETDTSKFEDIRAACQLVKEIVQQDSSLPPAVKLYISQLVAQVIDCLDNFEMQGNFELQVAIERLNTAVSYAQATSKKSNLWEDVRSALIVHGVSAVLTGGVMLLGISYPSAATHAGHLLQLDLPAAQIAGTANESPEIGQVQAPAGNETLDTNS